MTIRKTVILTTLTAIVTLGATGMALAYGGQHGMGHGKGSGQGSCHERGEMRGMMGMKGIDNLTEAQQGQLKTIAESHREQMQSQRKQLQESRQALHQAIAQGAKASELDVLASQQAELMKQQILQRAEQGQQMMAVLTDEQRAQVQQRGEARMERMGKQCQQ